MKIVIPGGTGQIGRLLSRYFANLNHEVVLLSRQQSTPESLANYPNVRMALWDGKHVDAWANELEGADVVINLAGRSVNCRYHARNRKEMINSCIDSARVVGEAIQQCDQPPKIWLQASTATIYCHRYAAPNDERTGILGGNEPDVPKLWDFSIEIAKKWEATANAFELPNTRLVLMRSAMTMVPEPGGVFGTLLNLVRFGLGGRICDGEQYMSWIHEEDFCRAVSWLIETDSLRGAVNLTSPHPLPQKDFMRALRKAWGKRIGLPASRWMLEVGTFFMRTESELVLKSRRVVPGRLQESGFDFHFPTWPKAAHDLCERWKSRS